VLILHEGAAEHHATEIPWYFQLVTEKGKLLLNAATEAPFPETQISSEYSIFEIHGPAIKGELAESVSISVDDVEEISLSYQSEEDNGAHDRLKEYEPFFDQVMDTMLMIVREALGNETFLLDNHYWFEIMDDHLSAKIDDPANYSLVVDLARPKQLIEPMHRVTERPKRILRRIHDQVRVQKVREIDTKCLTDLAKRPGAVLAEKAGPKQRILAIRRTESIDTLENRVTRHCCELLNISSRRYLNRNRRYTAEESIRIRNVEKLQRIAVQTPRKESFSGVPKLGEPCRQPNYTLLQNADYHRIWKAYVELVRNEDLRNQLWMWNRRLWADYVKVYLSSILDSFMNSIGPETMQLIGQKTVLSERRHQWGRWLLDDSLPGPYLVEPNTETPMSIYLLDGRYKELSQISPELETLSALNADVLIVSSNHGRIKTIPIYAIMPSHHLSNEHHSIYLEEMLPTMMKAVRAFNTSSTNIQCLGGWALLANWRDVDVPTEAKNLSEGLTCWTTSVPADSRRWNDDNGNWADPLFSICGVG